MNSILWSVVDAAFSSYLNTPRVPSIGQTTQSYGYFKKGPLKDLVRQGASDPPHPCLKG